MAALALLKGVAEYKEEYQENDSFIMSNKKFLLIPESSETPTSLTKLEQSLIPSEPVSLCAERAGVLERDYSQQVYELKDGKQVRLYTGTH